MIIIDTSGWRGVRGVRPPPNKAINLFVCLSIADALLDWMSFGPPPPKKKTPSNPLPPDRDDSGRDIDAGPDRGILEEGGG